MWHTLIRKVNMVRLSSSDKGGEMKTTSSVESVDARKSLLQWLHPFVLVLLVFSLTLVLLVTPMEHGIRRAYTLLIIGLIAMTLLAYVLNLKNRYNISAFLTVAMSVIGTWSSLLISYSLQVNDLFPLVYVSITVILAGLFLPLRFAMLLALLQVVGCIALVMFYPVASAFNWPSCLVFIIALSVLSIASNYIRKNQMMQLQNYAIRDHLTGLFNRRYFEETLENKVLRAEHNTLSLALILLDIDGFKHYNDQYGHDAGDVVLKAVADILFNTVSLKDIVCRYGGDEFIIIVPYTKIQNVQDLCQKFRSELKKMELIYQTTNLGVVTISQGVALFPQHGTAMQTLVNHADEALYKAKEEGRDRVVFSK